MLRNYPISCCPERDHTLRATCYNCDAQDTRILRYFSLPCLLLSFCFSILLAHSKLQISTLIVLILPLSSIWSPAVVYSLLKRGRTFLYWRNHVTVSHIWCYVLLISTLWCVTFSFTFDRLTQFIAKGDVDYYYLNTSHIHINMQMREEPLYNCIRDARCALITEDLSGNKELISPTESYPGNEASKWHFEYLLSQSTNVSNCPNMQCEVSICNWLLEEVFYSPVKIDCINYWSGPQMHKDFNNLLYCVATIQAIALLILVFIVKRSRV